MTRNLTGIERLSHWEAAEAVGILISVNDGKIVLEARRRFEIRAKAPTSLRNALGKVVGVAVIDGRIRWRLAETAPEPTEGGPP
jgi:hypothetical protein